MKQITHDRTGGNLEVVRASPEDVDTAADVLARAFAVDPHVVGLLPRGDVLRRLTLLWRRILRETLDAGGHAYLARRRGESQVLGVALWEAPGEKVSLRQMVPGLRAYLSVFRQRLPDALVSEYLAHRAHPDAPHWYLKAVGTVPQAQGEGVGTVLLEERLREVDREHVQAYLEASTEHLVPYYARFGFVPRGPVPCRGTVPAIAMVRPAVPAAA